MVELFQAVLLGVVEGFTEFMPVSSTGHLIVTGHLIGFEGPKAASFDVFIQLGAILAVVVLYSDRFFSLLSLKKGKGFSGMNGLILLALTTSPALFFGALFHSLIKEHLFSPITVAIGLGVGGVVILLAEARLPEARRFGVDALGWKDALSIGFFQCLAMWPGVSRSASTIVGGMVIGIERKTAAEYSFLAAVPVMCAATIFDIYKSRAFLEVSDIPMFFVGFLVSFIASLFALRFFIRLLGRMTLKPFGWYRIGAAILIFLVFRGF
jgi:undecaprenyl-diphosphatase